MKRLLSMLFVASILMFCLSSVVMAQDEPTGENLVKICHVNGGNTQFTNLFGQVMQLGNIIYIAESAVDAHAAHGDSITEDFWSGSGFLDWRTFLGYEWGKDNAIANGAKVTNADCQFRITAP